MKDDQTLIDAGIDRARAIIVATNDDLANIEVAMDARQRNKNVRILLRLWDQQIAMKIAGAMTIDAPFSASALAAPIVAAMSLKTKVLSSTVIGGVPHVVCEIRVEPASPLAGKRIDQIEMGYSAKILARTPKEGSTESHPSAATLVREGDTIVAHTSASQVATLAVAAGSNEAQAVGAR
jgi:Trk K+ transport system NAD-binding subunit